jgi:hypothetical protein
MADDVNATCRTKSDNSQNNSEYNRVYVHIYIGLVKKIFVRTEKGMPLLFQMSVIFIMFEITCIVYFY